MIFEKGHCPWNKGKKRPPFSKEWKENISKALKGNPKMVTRGRTGMPHTEETKRKMRLSSIGSRSPEGLRRIGEAHIGSKNKLWKGGTTALQKKLRNSFPYRQWRSDVFTRDDFTCQECNVRSGNGVAIYLNAHHIKELSIIIAEYKLKTLQDCYSCAELWNINNGKTLCVECHSKTKRGRGILKKI